MPVDIPWSEQAAAPGSAFWRGLRTNRLALVGGGILAGFLLLALTAPLIAPHDPFEQDLYNRLSQPSLTHPFGTDDFGRDVLSRVVHGARISLRIGVVAVMIALVLGTAVGITSGYWGGLIDAVLMRAMDLMLAFPSILLAICIVAVLGPGLENAMLAVGIVAVPQYARLVRASALSVRQMDYVQAARALGAGDLRILSRSVLPNCLAPLIVQSTLGLATAILDAAGLSFLGLGAQPPLPEWGAMLSGARELVLKAPWTLTFPGLAIFLTVLGFNLLGDGLRDALDPRT
ncbi:MAG: ABC transporter permease [Candidatus Latescibacteria bacterium]|jgi:ABC-type dipeptide/oligopeptide/nickel transport system permease subunit|nr:ABC transporter permease [Candidatus Latescibacterota bacterium]